MRNRHPKRLRRAAAAAAVALALALAWSAGSARAEDADDDENVPLDSKIFRQFMKDLGLKREGDAVRIEQLLVSPRHEHEGIGRRQAGRRRDDLRRAATNQGQKRNERASTPRCCI